MGLFEKVKASQSSELILDPQLALMIIVVAAIDSDGSFSQEEITRLRAMCTLSPIFASNTAEKDLALFDAAQSAISNLGKDSVSRAAQQLPPKLHDTAFALACDMVLADGSITPEEEQCIERLARSLTLGDRVAESIVLATLARNRSL